MIKLKKETYSYVKQILFLATPIIVENILQTLLGTVDTYFAGSLDNNAIAAIGVTTLIMNIYIAFYTAISVGVSVVISRYIGQKNIKKANETARQAILLGAYLGLGIGVLSFIFRNVILKISGAEADILAYAVPYYCIVAVSSVLVCLSLILSACLRSSKDTKTPMVVTGISNVINIGLNYLFIKMGFGIIGLALATTISRLLVVVLLGIKLIKRKNGIHLHLKKMKFNKEISMTVIKIGIPAGVEKLIMRIGQLIYNGIVISISTNAYVAHQIAGTIEFYSYIPAFGFGMAVATMVGISLGEDNPQKAKKIVWIADILATISMVIIGIIFYVFSPYLAKQFTKTIEVQNIVVSVLRMIALFQPLIALAQIMASALQGGGDTKFPMYSTFIGTWVIHIGFGYLLGVVMGYGLFGIWLAYALNNAIRGILLLIRFLRGRWQKIKI